MLTITVNSTCTYSVLTGPIPCSYGQCVVNIQTDWINNRIKANKTLRANEDGKAVTNILHKNKTHEYECFMIKNSELRS